MNGGLFHLLASRDTEPDTPPIVKAAMKRIADRLSKPPVPLMSQEEFNGLGHLQRVILTCNMPGCGDVVSTHGLLCVKHKKESNEANNKSSDAASIAQNS